MVSWAPDTTAPFAPDTTDYVVQYSPQGLNTWTSYAHTASTATSLTIGSLSSGTTYDIRVAAVNNAGTGPYSTVFVATTSAGMGSYAINTCQDLQDMQNDLAGTYTLASDIDCSGFTFSPVGTGSVPFTGSLDGGHYTISHLSIADYGNDNVGLFGATGSANVSNLSVVNESVAGRNNVAGLVGNMEGGTVTNVYVDASVGGSGSIAGGLAGNVNSATITTSHTSGVINGHFATGGLVGYDTASSIADVYNTASVTTTNFDAVGGIAGTTNNTYIRRAYNSGHISGDPGSTVGGVVGFATGTSAVVRAINTGAIDYHAGSVGALVGAVDTHASLVNSYWNNGGNGAIGAVGSTYGSVTNVQMVADRTSLYDTATAAAFTAWDFSSTWITSIGMPLLRAFPPTAIYTCSDLQNIDHNLTASYYLARDINCAAAASWNNGAGFQPIGLSGGSNFNGTLDGDGYTISNLSITGQSQNAALFGTGYDATVKNLHLTNFIADGQEYVGAIFGAADDITIDHVTVAGTVGSGSLILHGGLVGLLQGDGATPTLITQSSFTGNVSGGDSTGGLVGLLGGSSDNTMIDQSYFEGNVNGGPDTGGLVGYLQQAAITNSYVHGTISGANAVGGLMGNGVFDSNVTDNYVSGSITADSNVRWNERLRRICLERAFR